jgi:hypothetical protein
MVAVLPYEYRAENSKSEEILIHGLNFPAHNKTVGMRSLRRAVHSYMSSINKNISVLLGSNFVYPSRKLPTYRMSLQLPSLEYTFESSPAEVESKEI